jgi:cyanophycinase
MSIGNLLIIGGSEDKKGQCKILRHFANAAGGPAGYAVILTTATEEAAGMVGKTYVEIFHKLGIGKADVMDINSRDDANLEKYENMVANATAIFFTGGDQLRITSILGGTRLLKALHAAYSKGTIIAGTSAGASAMSSTMIVDGNGNEPARKCTLKMAPGLNFLGGVLIDQHFHQRGRIGRLLGGVAENPDILGIGIDEDTAVRTYPDGFMEVVGSYSVTIVDGRDIKSSNVSELKPDENLAIINVKIHVLPEGYGLDLKKREVRRLSS